MKLFVPRAFLLILWMLVPVWAAPRIAIVTPLAGTVTLGGKVLSKPTFAEEGQLLELGASGKARVQLLSSNRQAQLSGARKLTLSKVELASISGSVERGKLSVAAEAGNLQRSAAATTRATDPLGLTLVLPGTAVEGGWSFPLRIDEEHFQPKQEVAVMLGELGQPAQTFLLDGPSERLEAPGLALVSGRRYQLVVQGQSLQYQRVFQLLSEEERTELERVEVELLGARPSVPQLLRAANLWNDFDQTEDVARLLEKAVTSSKFGKLPEADQTAVVEALNRALDSLDRPAYKRG